MGSSSPNLEVKIKKYLSCHHPNKPNPINPSTLLASQSLSKDWCHTRKTNKSTFSEPSLDFDSSPFSLERKSPFADWWSVSWSCDEAFTNSWCFLTTSGLADGFRLRLPKPSFPSGAASQMIFIKVIFQVHLKSMSLFGSIWIISPNRNENHHLDSNGEKFHYRSSTFINSHLSYGFFEMHGIYRKPPNKSRIVCWVILGQFG